MAMMAYFIFFLQRTLNLVKRRPGRCSVPYPNHLSTAPKRLLVILRQAGQDHHRFFVTRSLRSSEASDGRARGYREVPEGQQRVGALVDAPPLIGELGADPAEIAASVGLDLAALQNPEIRSRSAPRSSYCRRPRSERDARILAFCSGNGTTPGALGSSAG